MPRQRIFHHPVEDACWGLRHAFGIDVWSGPDSFSFVTDSTIYWRNLEHTPLQGDHLFTPELDSQKQGFHFLINAWCYGQADCSPAMMPPLLQQHLLYHHGPMQPGPTASCGVLWSRAQYLGIIGSCPTVIAPVSFPSDLSCAFFLSTVNFFFYRHISLLLTNNQSDSLDSWYNQVWRSRILSQCSEEMKRQAFFFFFEEKISLTIWSTCHHQGWQT